jgi:uncharacterized membrane protein YdjX (TVP38/TMEM64 family)
VYASGLYRELTLEALVRHRADVDAFVTDHFVGALATYVAIYITAVSLSVPIAVLMSVTGGLLFGTALGGLAALASATTGATIVFLIARSAFGEWLIGRFGARARKLAHAFCADAFNYLLFVRLIPLFPFWLVNLVPALAGVALAPYLAATMLGMAPVTFAFAFFGSSLDQAIAGQEAAYRACLATGATDCRLHFNVHTAATPHLMMALALLACAALAPLLVRRFKSSQARLPAER